MRGKEKVWLENLNCYTCMGCGVSEMFTSLNRLKQTTSKKKTKNKQTSKQTKNCKLAAGSVRKK